MEQASSYSFAKGAQMDALNRPGPTIDKSLASASSVTMWEFVCKEHSLAQIDDWIYTSLFKFDFVGVPVVSNVTCVPAINTCRLKIVITISFTLAFAQFRALNVRVFCFRRMWLQHIDFE